MVRARPCTCSALSGRFPLVKSKLRFELPASNAKRRGSSLSRAHSQATSDLCHTSIRQRLSLGLGDPLGKVNHVSKPPSKLLDSTECRPRYLIQHWQTCTAQVEEDGCESRKLLRVSVSTHSHHCFWVWLCFFSRKTSSSEGVGVSSTRSHHAVER